MNGNLHAVRAQAGDFDFQLAVPQHIGNDHAVMLVGRERLQLVAKLLVVRGQLPDAMLRQLELIGESQGFVPDRVVILFAVKRLYSQFYTLRCELDRAEFLRGSRVVCDL